MTAPFTEADEPLTTRDIAERLVVPSRTVRACYYRMLQQMPDHPNIKPINEKGRTRFLKAATANQIAKRIRARQAPEGEK